MFDYPFLAAVATVVRERSFERAARVLNVTPSAVSQRIKLLEDRLGRLLIVRGTPCVPTETGRLLCRHVENVGMLEKDLHGALPELDSIQPENGRVTLRVAINGESLSSWFIGAMSEFLKSENVLLDIAMDDQDCALEWLRSGCVLAAITAHANPVQGCNSIALGRSHYAAVASPTFCRRHFSDGVTPATLACAPSLRFNSSDCLHLRWMQKVFRRDIDIPTHTFPSTKSLIDATVAGIGWGVNPMSLVEAHIREGTLVELVPGRKLTVPMYWQHTRVQVPMLGRLTRTVVKAGTRAFKVAASCGA